MTETEQRIQRSTKTFTYMGQPTSEWPSWMVFLNFATDGASKIVIHLLDEILVIGLGDTIHRKADGQMTIVYRNILRFPERMPIVEASDDKHPAPMRTEAVMSL